VLSVAANEFYHAEIVIKRASREVIRRTASFIGAVNDIAYQGNSRFHKSTQLLRRHTVRLCWELELCLWIHGGGSFPISKETFKQAKIAVRTGILSTAWGCRFDILKALVTPDVKVGEAGTRHVEAQMNFLSSNVPDFKVGEAGTRHVQAQMNFLSSNHVCQRSSYHTIGGWESLVYCSRSEAAAMLRDRPTGCIIFHAHNEDLETLTLSFTTNVAPSCEGAESSRVSSEPIALDRAASRRKTTLAKEHIVQHAVIRLSEAGFRCGSHGPFSSLLSLLEAVSSSLPGPLQVKKQLACCELQEECRQMYPNAFLLWKMFRNGNVSPFCSPRSSWGSTGVKALSEHHAGGDGMNRGEDFGRSLRLVGFLKVLVLSIVERQLNSIVAADHDGSEGDSLLGHRVSQGYQILGPIARWRQSLELLSAHDLDPICEPSAEYKDDMSMFTESTRMLPVDDSLPLNNGDAILRSLIKEKSCVDVIPLRLTNGTKRARVDLLSHNDMVRWMQTTNLGVTESQAQLILALMEKSRVIKPFELHQTLLQKRGIGRDTGIRYHPVDPWQVEVLDSKENKAQCASLGRETYCNLDMTIVSSSADPFLRLIGEDNLIGLWRATRAGQALSRTIATVHPPWESFSTCGVAEPSSLSKCIGLGIRRNQLFRRLSMPQRFVVLIQVDLLDLKMALPDQGYAASLSVYALLRLRRLPSGPQLTNKTKTLDTATTHLVHFGKTLGANAEVPWGSVTRFRFPIPDGVAIDSVSYNQHREALFPGHPRMLQLTVYEKKVLGDHVLGAADICIDDISIGDPLEEWVPLQPDRRGLQWVARVRLTLDFELLCLTSEEFDHHTT
jgi:hypothetical protein